MSTPAVDAIGEQHRCAPSDRFYARLHWSLIALIAAAALYGLVIARFVQTPRGVGFRMVIFTMLVFNTLWWSVADRRFARHIASGRVSGALRIITAAFTLALISPLVYMFATGRIPQFVTGPVWYASAVTLWNIGLAFCLPLIAGARLGLIGLIWGMKRLVAPRATSRAPASVTNGAPLHVSQAVGGPARLPIQFDPSRRALLRTAVATGPMVLLGASVFAWRDQARFLVRRHTRVCPWLPERLRGLTITHVSDLHVGRLFRPQMLPRVVDAVNGLDSDLLLITGDIVDNSNDLLPPVLDAIGEMRHRYGRFLCIGNHDEIDNRDAFVSAVRQRFDLLINRRRSLEIGGERLCIAGIDYAGGDDPTPRRLGHHRNVEQTLFNYAAQTEGPLIALAHHPHTWDALRARGVPLTLSGHTHGGQVMFAPPEASADLGAGQLLFRYIRGFYGDDASWLFVNSGVGNWFPVRINAPAEIVQLRLV